MIEPTTRVRAPSTTRRTQAPGVNAATSGHHPALHNVLAYVLRRQLHDTAPRTDCPGSVLVAVNTLTAAVSSQPVIDPRHLCAIGLFHWHRFLDSNNEDVTELQAAVDYLSPCLLAGIEPLPDALRPLLADHAVAANDAQNALHATEPTSAVSARWRRIIAATPPKHPRRAHRLMHLGICLAGRFSVSGDIDDIDEAVAAFAQAFIVASKGHADVGYLTAVGISPTSQSSPPEHAVLVAAASNLVAAVRHRGSSVAGPPNDDGAAVVATLRAAAAGTDADSDHLLLDFAAALVETPADVGLDPRRLILAERVLDEALIDSDAATRARLLTRLGSILLDHHGLTQSTASLRRALTRADEALALVAETTPQWLDTASVAAQAHLMLFQRTRLDTHLDESIHLSRRVIAGRGRAGALNAAGDTVAAQLADALQRRYELRHNDDDLDESIRWWRSPATAPTTPLQRSWHAHKFASALLDRFERDQKPADLDLAVANAQSAVAILPASHGDHAWHLTILGVALRTKYRISGADGDRVAAGNAFADAVMSESAPPAVRIRAARAAATLLATDILRVSVLLETAVGLFVDAIPADADPADQQHVMSDFLSISSDAAAAMLEHDASRSGVERAIRVLERGRGVLLRLRTTGAGRLGGEGVEASAPLTTQQLLRAAAEGPIVIVNTSRRRCDALLVQTTTMTAVPLAVTRADIIARLLDFYRAVYASTDDRLPPTERRAAQIAIHIVLEWLWDHIAEPVLDVLDPPADDAANLRRLWWAPGGLLGLLPLHAAGHHRGADPARTVMDRVVSSYTTTVAALLNSRAHEPIPADSALVVAMPVTPGHQPLPYTRTEGEAVAALLPNVTESLDGDATSAAVLAGLQRHRVVHLACHAVTDADDPSRSRLLLSDHDRDPLTIARLSGVRLAHGGLVYMSACETAFAVSVRLLDESIHLAAAIQAGGCPQVVATLWLVDDALSVDVAERFYRHLRPSNDHAVYPTQTALALHAAIREIRAQRLMLPSVWTAYTHTGA